MGEIVVGHVADTFDFFAVFEKRVFLAFLLPVHGIGTGEEEDLGKDFERVRIAPGGVEEVGHSLIRRHAEGGCFFADFGLGRVADGIEERFHICVPDDAGAELLNFQQLGGQPFFARKGEDFDGSEQAIRIRQPFLAALGNSVGRAFQKAPKAVLPLFHGLNVPEVIGSQVADVFIEGGCRAAVFRRPPLEFAPDETALRIVHKIDNDFSLAGQFDQVFLVPRALEETALDGLRLGHTEHQSSRQLEGRKTCLPTPFRALVGDELHDAGTVRLQEQGFPGAVARFGALNRQPLPNGGRQASWKCGFRLCELDGEVAGDREVELVGGIKGLAMLARVSRRIAPCAGPAPDHRGEGEEIVHPVHAPGGQEKGEDGGRGIPRRMLAKVFNEPGTERGGGPRREIGGCGLFGHGFEAY